MKANATSVTGSSYEVELEPAGVDEDGIMVMVGRLPFPLEDLISARVDVLPARTSIRFVDSDHPA